jgi:glycosyltransferase involved in cell wall biosynthesis
VVTKRQIKILFLPKYSLSGPSSRYRFYQYFEIIKTYDIRFSVSPFFRDSYVNIMYSSGRKSYIEAFISFIRRFFLFFSFFRYDLIVIEYELLPYFPAIFEKLLRIMRKNYIVDYDDAVFLKYDLNKRSIVKTIFRRKIEKVIQSAQAVITGNKYLYDYALKFNTNVHLIPTVVSRIRYDEVPPPVKKEKFILGWTGSLTTSKYIIPLCTMFRDLKREDIQINLIGFDKQLRYLLEGIDVNWIDWTQETEIEEIKKFSVGIMPLADDAWSAGKCGFKLIQYMACKLPVIASPVGVNKEMIVNGINGFLVSGIEDWKRSILFLADNPAEAMIMGKKGYAKFIDNYSLESVTEKYITVITSSIG